MRLNDFHYHLPQKLIAQFPLPQRDQSNLLVVDRSSGQFQDAKFLDLVHYLSPDDALIINETKVFPARLRGQKEKTDSDVEVFLLRELHDSLW